MDAVAHKGHLNEYRDFFFFSLLCSRYIYIPLGGSQAGLFRTGLASLATFFFIGYWHGGGQRYLMWSLLNFVEVILELAGASLERSPLVQRHLVSELELRTMVLFHWVCSWSRSSPRAHLHVVGMLRFMTLI